MATTDLLGGALIELKESSQIVKNIVEKKTVGSKGEIIPSKRLREIGVETWESD